MGRAVIAVLLCAAALQLSACEREVIDHAAVRAAERRDGGAPAEDQCRSKQDSARCDDWNACTPSSSCRAGQCVAGNAFDDCTIADSAADFGETQGELGWFYGFWDASKDPDGSYDAATDFSEMEYCGENTWRPPGICGLSQDDPAFDWTQDLAWGLQHPETDPDLQLPIRRWVSDVSGPASLLIEHHVDGQYSDGTRALLLFDGREVWRHDAAGGDPLGVSETRAIELSVGMVIDQLVHPIDSSADDTTYFTIRIEGR
jgi:hypothetical protein